MRIYWIFLAELWFGILSAQTPAYLHYTIQDGMPGNLVYCGLQDRRGLLWFGTDKGLSCFDGIRFRNYGVADGLPDPEVLHMEEDKQGRIWLICFSQKPCYWLNGRIFTEKNDPELRKIGFDSGQYYILEDTTSGALWFTGLSKFAFCVRADKIQVVEFPKWLICLRKIDDALLAIGSDCIYRYYSPDSIGHVYDIKLDIRQSPVMGLGVSKNHILMVYSDRLKLLEWQNGRIQEMMTRSGPPGKIFTDRRGRFWICSTAFGALCFDNPNRDLSNPTPYISGKKVLTMFEDKQGTYWFGTANDGVYALPANAPVSFFSTENSLSRNIRTINTTPSNTILTGDDVGNVHFIGPDTITRIPFNTSDGYNLIRQIVPYGDHILYIAMDEGIREFNTKTRHTRVLLDLQSVKGICMQRDVLWYVSNGSLGAVDPGQPFQRLVIQKRHTAIGIDADNYIWAGSIGGLFSQPDSFQFNWADRFPELKNRITAINGAGPGKLWVSTAGNGLLLVHIRNGAVTGVEAINTKLKKPIENIQSQFIEENGHIWLATNTGVYNLDTNWQVTHFDSHAGLINDDVNAVYVRHDTLWAGTVAGLTRIILHPLGDTGDFPTHIVNLRYQLAENVVENRLFDSLYTAHLVVLPAGSSNLSLDFAGLDYITRRNLRFEINRSNLLLPPGYWTFDNLITWLSTQFGRKQTINLVESGTFSFGAFLPPGKYRLKVTAITPFGLRSPYPDTWTIIRPPAWYESLWFYLALWCALAYAVWRYYKVGAAYREINASASALQLQALQSQMNPHFIGNAVNAIQQFLHPPNPEKTSEYIALFTRLLRRTMDFSDLPFIPFEEELSYDEEYLQLVHLRFENKFSYTLSGAETVPPDTPIPSMLLQPVLENATMHGIAPEGASILRLDFAYTEKLFRCTLTDNGIGFRESQKQKLVSSPRRKSRGLALLHKKVHSLNVLYHINLELIIEDLAETDSGQQGTRVTLTYNPQMIWKAIKKRLVPATAFGK